MIIEIDGNDGVGKTTYINKLKEFFPNDIFLDRRLLSKATLHPYWDNELKKNQVRNYKYMCPLNKNVCYILLDTYPKLCQERILKRGDSIIEKYHTMEDLILFQKRFLTLATSNKQRCIPIYSTHLDINENITKIVNYINGFKQAKNFMEIIIGTSNKGKIREIASILSPLGYDLKPQSLDIKEVGKTIQENAIIKALGYSKENPDKYVLVEDSGLVVVKLNGLPGAYSARFHSIEIDESLNVVNVPEEKFTTDKSEHDKKNNERLLELVKNIPFEERAAYFEVCFCMVKNGEILFTTSARSNGFINDKLVGNNGFGYDPLFVGNDTFGKTYAELDSNRKNLRSHRKVALKDLALWLTQNIKTN